MHLALHGECSPAPTSWAEQTRELDVLSFVSQHCASCTHMCNEMLLDEKLLVLPRGSFYTWGHCEGGASMNDGATRTMLQRQS